MRIFVTGAAGMLGTDLCAELGKAHKVTGLDIKRPAAVSFERFFETDITNQVSVYDSITQSKPDLVVHSAAYTDVDGCQMYKEKAYQVNALGTRYVAQSASDINCPLAYISTDFVFDGEKKTPYTEDDKPGPVSVYGQTKLQGEEIVSSLVKKHLIIRTSWTFGKNGKNFIESVLARARQGLGLSVVDDQVGSPTYTVDLSAGISKLLEKVFSNDALFGVYHITNAGRCSRYEEALKVVELAGLKGIKIQAVSSELAQYPAKRPKMSALSNEKFIKMIGQGLRPWDQALKDYLK